MATAANSQTSGIAASGPAFAIAPRDGLPAPALLMALCLAAGIALAQVRWFTPGPLLMGTVLLMAVTVASQLCAPRVSFFCAGSVCLLLGIFCAEVQPHPLPITPLMRIADATPTP